MKTVITILILFFTTSIYAQENKITTWQNWVHQKSLAIIEIQKLEHKKECQRIKLDTLKIMDTIEQEWPGSNTCNFIDKAIYSQKLYVNGCFLLEENYSQISNISFESISDLKLLKEYMKCEDK